MREIYRILTSNVHEANAVLYGVENALLYEQKEDSIFSKGHTMYEITNHFGTENYTSKPTDYLCCRVYCLSDKALKFIKTQNVWEVRRQ